MTHIEAMKQALELLKKLDRDLIIETWELAKVLGGLEQAIAEAEKRPFTYDQMKEHSEGMQRDYDLLLAEYNLLKKDQEYSKNILVKLREKYKKLNQAIAESEKQEPVECQYGKGGYACCEGGPCKADEQNNALFNQEQGKPVAWRNAAIRVGEDLCSVGPHGYYEMNAEQWLDWALSVVTVHLPPQQRTWVGLTDEEIDSMVEVTDLSGAYYYDDLYAVVRAIEAKLKEKNTQPIKWSDYESDGRIIKNYPEKDKT